MADRVDDGWSRQATALLDGARRVAGRWSAGSAGDRLRVTEGLGAAAEAYWSYTRRLTALAADYVTSVVRLGQELQSTLWEELGPRARPSGSSIGRQRLVVHGAVGGEVRASFVVENQGPSPISVSFEATDMVDDDGRRVAGALVLRPPWVSIEPGREAVVGVDVSLVDTTFFTAGRAYRAEVVAVGRPDLDVDLVVLTEPAASDGPP